MVAAFDGRYDTAGANLAGRVGCVEQALADITNENFYNKQPGLAKHLPSSIPEKSTTRPWRSYYNRFNVSVRNYSHYQLSGGPEIVDNPSFGII